MAISITCALAPTLTVPVYGREPEGHCILSRNGIKILIGGGMCGIETRGGPIQIWVSTRLHERSVAIEGKDGWIKTATASKCLQKKQDDATICYVENN